VKRYDRMIFVPLLDFSRKNTRQLDTRFQLLIIGVVVTDSSALLSEFENI
jgi:hypothetical protein